MKREDLIHPIVSGNKWRKLKYNLAEAKKEGHQTILSFGGAYSNHIHALALAAQEAGLKSIGIIRGEKTEPLNSTLSYAQSCGMELYFISREEYRRKNEEPFLNSLREKFGNFYLVPEGGSNVLGVKGCMEILPEIEMFYDVVCLPCGTGTTMAGIVASLPEGKKAIGFPVLKGGDFLYKEIDLLLGDFILYHHDSWQLEGRYHFGGYGKWNEELMQFIQGFKTLYGIQLEQIYTGKMMYGLMDMIRNDFFEKGTRIVAIHTGGVQGLKV
jgi:1-aminocyclopropane-1-carboxylate deaminase